ncbi:hypothetical protein ACHAWX_006952, partial [Stephanocyclus meneghinianus]
IPLRWPLTCCLNEPTPFIIPHPQTSLPGVAHYQTSFNTKNRLRHYTPRTSNHTLPDKID